MSGCCFSSPIIQLVKNYFQMVVFTSQCLYSASFYLLRFFLVGPLRTRLSYPDTDCFANFSACRAGIAGLFRPTNNLTFCGFGTGKSSEGWCDTKTLAKKLIGKRINKHNGSLCRRQDVWKEDTHSRCPLMVHFLSSRQDERQGEL